MTDPARRDRLRELLDAVVDAGNTAVGDMARSSFASEFHFSREVRRLTGESPAALRRRIMLERAAWRLRGGERVAAVAKDEGWSSAEVFSRAFRRTFGVPPSQADDIEFRLSAPNGGAIVWSKEVWLATIEGRDFPGRESTRPESTTAAQLGVHHEGLGSRWTTMVSEHTASGRLGDTIIDALCDPPESFQLYGIVAHVLTYSAHRRQLVRTMLARHGVETRIGDPLEWMRGN